MADDEELRSLPLIQRFGRTLGLHAPRRLREFREVGRRTKRRAARNSRLRGYPR